MRLRRAVNRPTVITDRAGQPIRAIVSGKLAMPYLEYPKHIYPDGEMSQPSIVVHTPEQEAAARERGYLALPAHPPVDEAQPGGPKHLPYPRILYRDGLIDGNTVRVENAEAAAAAADAGFYALGEGPAADTAPEAPKKRGRPAKG